jgi:hypothetical protein
MRLLVSCYLLGGKKADVENLINTMEFPRVKEQGEKHDS